MSVLDKARSAMARAVLGQVRYVTVGCVDEPTYVTTFDRFLDHSPSKADQAKVLEVFNRGSKVRLWALPVGLSAVEDNALVVRYGGRVIEAEITKITVHSAFSRADEVEVRGVVVGYVDRGRSQPESDRSDSPPDPTSAEEVDAAREAAEREVGRLPAGEGDSAAFPGRATDEELGELAREIQAKLSRPSRSNSRVGPSFKPPSTVRIGDGPEIPVSDFKLRW